MIKGISGCGYRDTLVIPVLHNTDHECDIVDELTRVIESNPHTFCVLIRRHGLYVWGDDWKQVTSVLARVCVGGHALVADTVFS
jgi:ribulose-5-phosphate 4-epimerase/fuculose-1-phosphate aldolase